MKRVLIILTLLLSSLSSYADIDTAVGLLSVNEAIGVAINSRNNFLADSNCVGLWSLETGAGQIVDTRGDNDFTIFDAPAEETTYYKEWSASADFETGDTDALYIEDTDLDSGFPGKVSGGSANLSICLWFRPESATGDDETIFSKYDPNGGNRSWRVKLEGDDGKIYLQTGKDSGTDFQTNSPAYGTALTNAQWYHIGITLDSSDNYRIRIWDDTVGDFLDFDATGTFTDPVSWTEASKVILGAQQADTSYSDWLDGMVDEVVVFKDILTTDEIDEIRNGSYRKN